MSAYVYVVSEPETPLYTVGFFDPNGKWHPESDFNSREDAAKRVAYLNGANAPLPAGIQEALNSGDGSYRP